MRVCLLLVTLLIAASASATAAQAPQRPPLTNYDPNTWKPFISQEGSFEVAFPGTPAIITIPQDTPLGRLLIHVYAVRTTVAEFGMSYIDVPAATAEPQFVKGFLDGGRDQMVRDGAVVISEKDISLNSVKGRDLMVTVDGTIGHNRFFLIKGRLYSLSIATTPQTAFKGGKPSPAESDRTDFYQTISGRFFGSFKITLADAVADAPQQTTSGAEEILAGVDGKTDLYPADADAKKEIGEAVSRAAVEHKLVLLIFGANWCYDCHVLDHALHDGESGKIVGAKFLLVHVDIGEGAKNGELINKYKIPLDKGVPAVAILDVSGKLLYSSGDGEFEAARKMMKRDLVSFLRRWQPESRAKSIAETEGL